MTRRAHGSRSRYTDGCRCDTCRAANRAYENQRARLTAYGLATTGLVDAGPARDHVRALVEAGIGVRRIAELAGLPRVTVTSLLNGRPGRAPTRRLHPATAAALLAVRPDPTNRALVDATGTHRRLQALTAVGWSLTGLAARLGVTAPAVGILLRQARVRAATARRVRALYDQLWDTPPPETTPAERTAASWARNRAAERGWPPPLAWDDDTIDDPQAEPDTGKASTRQDALAEDAAWLMAQGHPRGVVAARLGVSEDYLGQVLRRAQRAA